MGKLIRKPFAIVNLLLAVAVFVIGIVIIAMSAVWYTDKFYSSDGSMQDWSK
jgi:hypothetical protein